MVGSRLPEGRIVCLPILLPSEYRGSLPRYYQSHSNFFFGFVPSVGELGAEGGSTICLLYGYLAEGVFASAGVGEGIGGEMLELEPSDTSEGNHCSCAISSMKILLQGPSFLT